MDFVITVFTRFMKRLLMLLVWCVYGILAWTVAIIGSFLLIIAGSTGYLMFRFLGIITDHPIEFIISIIVGIVVFFAFILLYFF